MRCLFKNFRNNRRCRFVSIESKLAVFFHFLTFCAILPQKNNCWWDGFCIPKWLSLYEMVNYGRRGRFQDELKLKKETASKLFKREDRVDWLFRLPRHSALQLPLITPMWADNSWILHSDNTSLHLVRVEAANLRKEIQVDQGVKRQCAKGIKYHPFVPGTHDGLN